MPLPFISVPAFPSVPKLPGVPPLVRDALQGVVDRVTSVLADTLGLGFANKPEDQWGIFDDEGTPVLRWDSIVAVDYLKEYRISNYPQEEGGFQSYNKVELPSEPRLTLTRGGTENERAQFLNDLTRVCASLELFTVVTPEVIYSSVNFTHFDYRRDGDRGAGLITATVHLEEVRLTATSEFTSTKTAAGQSTVNDGTVQTKAAPISMVEGFY